MKRNKTKELLSQISLFFRRGKRKRARNLQFFLELVNREPMNATAHLKMAEIYQKHGEKKNARSEYLRAADIFCNAEQYNKGAAIYNKVLQQEPELEFVKTREVEKLYLNYNYQMGLVCKEMGLIDEAIKQFQIALEKKQKSIESAKLLDQCLIDKRCREEGRQSSGRTLQEENIGEVAKAEVPYETVTAFQKLLPQL